MKVWGWFAVAALWLAIVVAITFDFSSRTFGGFGIGIGNWLPPNVGIALAAFLLYLILLGWLIPLSIGVVRLVRSKLVR